MAAAPATYDNRAHVSRKHPSGVRPGRSRPPTVYYTHDRHGEIVELTARDLEARSTAARQQLALTLEGSHGG